MRDSPEVAAGAGGGGINDWVAEGSSGGSEVLESSGGGGGNTVGSVGPACGTLSAGGCDRGACDVEAKVVGAGIPKKS